MAHTWIQEGFPAKRVLKIASVPRSTYYYRLSHSQTEKHRGGGRPIPGFSKTLGGKKVKDGTIKRFLMRLLEGNTAIYGYRKLTICLQRMHGLIINKKKVYRLCQELNILLPQREKTHKPPRHMVKNRTVTGPNQLWQLDIKYGYVKNSRRYFFLASAIDVYDRAIVGYYQGKVCEAKSIVKMLGGALTARGIHEDNDDQLVICTDNGPQFCSHVFARFCDEHRVRHERIPPSSPNLNAYIESFHSLIERECFLRHEFWTFDQAFQNVDQYMRFYNEERLHGSLYDWPPEVFNKKWKAGEVKPFEVTLLGYKKSTTG